jgi:hypothetical protein
MCVRGLPVIGIPLEWVVSPEQHMSSGRIATLASGQACLGQNTGIKKKLIATYKQNAL